MHSTVRKANQIKQEEKFGSLDCDHSFLVISHGKIKNLAVFARRILVTGTKQLRSKIFLPVLYANHFILIWFCKRSCHITVFDSTERQSHSIVSVIEVLLSIFLPVLMIGI